MMGMLPFWDGSIFYGKNLLNIDMNKEKWSNRQRNLSAKFPFRFMDGNFLNYYGIYKPHLSFYWRKSKYIDHIFEYIGGF